MKLNPLLTIWTQPKETVRQLIEENKIGLSVLLVMIAGIGGVITALQDSGWFLDLSPILLIIGILITGLLSGLLNLGISTLLYTGIGKLYGGHGKLRDMAIAIGPMMIPQVFVVPVLVIFALYYGERFFMVPEAFGITSISLGAYLFLTLLTATASIWSIVISSKAIGVVHGFSSWRGFGVLMTLLGIVILVTLIIVIAVIMFMF
ncbi:YIP1 family protein [Planomicrobium okeanokoites]|uniref:YIP1 family protein n=1 Tax=Planomicrobium okeanokoites TaxID=244 RepID=UPI0024921A2B|nr:YIP1 family protein [Planomicrobium okeanokoites]